MSEKWGDSPGDGDAAAVREWPVYLDGQELFSGIVPPAVDPGGSISTGIGAFPVASPSRPEPSRSEPSRSEAPPAETVPVQAVAPALVFGPFSRAWRALLDAVSDLLEGRERLWVLEAGAGTRTLFELPEDAFVVGVDRDPMALEYNARLDQRVATDLAGYRPAVAGFDLITCWYILDGLADPGPVLDRFAEWVGEEGLVVLAVPNLRSVRGLLARLRGRTRLRQQVTPRAMRRRFAEHGFVPVFQCYYEDSDQVAWRRRLRITQGRWTLAQAAVRVLSLGLLDAARTDYIVVFRRPA